jgi:polysaccharide biosynthesis protein PslH
MRILLVTQSLPWPMRRNGGSQRTELLRRALMRWGEVDVIGVGGDERLTPQQEREFEGSHHFLGHFDVTPLSKPTVRAPWPARSLLYQRELWRRKYTPDAGVVRWIREQQPTRRYDLIVGRYLKAAAKAGLLEQSNIPTLLDLDDIDYRLFQSHLEQTPWPGLGGKLAASLVTKQLRSICDCAVRQFSATWVCSEEDAELLPSRNVHVLPNVPYREANDAPLEALPADASSRSILFVGDATYLTNRVGVDRFIREAWPIVKQAVQDATFIIAGKLGSGEPYESWKAQPGIRMQGFVENLTQAYRECAIAVAPIWSGGGTKIKVVEALSYGRPCVTTTHGLRGYGPLVRDGVLEGFDEPASMAHACVQLLTNPTRRLELGQRAASLAREHYSIASFNKAVDRTIAPLLTKNDAQPARVLEVPT